MHDTSPPPVFQTSYGWTMNPISPAIVRPPAREVRPFRKLRIRRRNKEDERVAHPGEVVAQSLPAGARATAR